MFGRFRTLRLSLTQQLCNSLALPFLELLEISELNKLVENSKVKFYDRIYTPLVTILAFIAQVLDSDCSCRKAVSRVLALTSSAVSGGKQPSENNAAYCKARSRLPLSLIWDLIHWSERRIESQVKVEDLWLGRHHVRTVDGSSCKTPDTKANREAFGLPSGVKPGCGFPVLFFVGVFSLTTALFQSLRFGKPGGHERHLFRELMVEFAPGDVILTDRGFCSFADICLLKQRDVECVMRILNRKPDYQTGQRLGKRDHIVEWTKPKRQPTGLSPEAWAALPEKLRVREVRIVVEQKGFRAKALDIVTTLLDAKIYTKDAIASLYRRRWSIELNFRHIKTTLGMELLRTKTPAMVYKEVLIYMLAYNLIRSLIWAAQQTYRIDIERISFKGTLQHLATASPYLAIADASEYSRRHEELIRLVSKEQVPDRPDRIEPRVIIVIY